MRHAASPAGTEEILACLPLARVLLDVGYAIEASCLIPVEVARCLAVIVGFPGTNYRPAPESSR